MAANAYGAHDDRVALNMSSTSSGYVAFGDVGGREPSHLSAETLSELIALLSAAGCHSTDVSDAVDAAGLDWPSNSK